MIELNWPAIGFSALPNLGGVAGGLITRRAINPWYESLKKPNWRPPNRAFAPVWTALYTSVGYASYLVYRDGGGFDGAARVPLIVYGTNLAANWLWTPIFFGKKDIKLALYEMQLVNGTALGMAYLFYKINPTAGLLVVPYCLWLCVATALNYTIYRDNKEKVKEITD
ncbi:unnamed protein product [Phyllotreta striolata]|uniref:Translocator protein n=1 Tax=Phyllotreta striolata TaxID=444603 RepID=A0A9N9TUM3_PHYSR|nr:unnamed protein product [Phyllotreta striolata]